MSSVVFSSIRECPELRDVVAQWLWSFWGNPRNYEFYRSLTAHTNVDDIPMIYVASIDGDPVGTSAIL